MSKIFERLRELERYPEDSLKNKVVLQNFAMGQQEREVQDLRNETEKLRQTIAILETNWESFNRESGTAKAELEEARSRFQELSQEVAARDKKLEEVTHTHQLLVEEFKAEIQGKTARIGSLEQETENLRAEYQQRIQGLEEQVEQRECEVQDLRKDAEQRDQTINLLETDKKTLGQKTSELETQLQKSRDRLEVLSQEMASREKEFEEAEQTRKALIEELEGGIQVKTEQVISLEKEIEDVKAEHQQKVKMLGQQVRQRDHEVQNLQNEAQQLRQTIAILEADREVFTRKSAEIKGQLEESISRLQVLSRKLTTRGKEQEMVQSRCGEEGSTPEEIQKLWATHRQKLRPVKLTLVEESHSDPKRN